MDSFVDISSAVYVMWSVSRIYEGNLICQDLSTWHMLCIISVYSICHTATICMKFDMLWLPTWHMVCTASIKFQMQHLSHDHLYRKFDVLKLPTCHMLYTNFIYIICYMVTVWNLMCYDCQHAMWYIQFPYTVFVNLECIHVNKYNSIQDKTSSTYNYMNH